MHAHTKFFGQTGVFSSLKNHNFQPKPSTYFLHSLIQFTSNTTIPSKLPINPIPGQPRSFTRTKPNTLNMPNQTVPHSPPHKSIPTLQPQKKNSQIFNFYIESTLTKPNPDPNLNQNTKIFNPILQPTRISAIHKSFQTNGSIKILSKTKNNHFTHT